MYYRYDSKYIIIEKSEHYLEGNNVAFCDDNIDIEAYYVTIGFLSPENVILRYTKKIRDINKTLEQVKEAWSLSAEVELEIDYRLSKLELGI